MKSLNRKSITAFLLAASMVLSACGSEPATSTQTSQSSTPASTSTSSEAAVQTPAVPDSTGLTISYPSNMQAIGFEEDFHMDTMPERIVTLVFTIDLILADLGIDVVAYNRSSIVNYPDGYGDNKEYITTAAEDFSMESVVALEPDLVMLSHSQAETYGQICVDAGIPVYYIYAGHDKSYENIRDEVEVIATGFASEQSEVDALLKPFADLEARIESVRPNYEGKRMLVFQSRPPAHYVLADSAVLASMLSMLGFENSYDGSAGGMVLLDYEEAIDYEFDYFFATAAGTTAEETQKLMEDDFANMPDYWDLYEPIKNGNVTYLPIYYASSSGTQTVDRINDLIDILEAQYGE